MLQKGVLRLAKGRKKVYGIQIWGTSDTEEFS